MGRTALRLLAVTLLVGMGLGASLFAPWVVFAEEVPAGASALGAAEANSAASADTLSEAASGALSDDAAGRSTSSPGQALFVVSAAVVKTNEVILFDASSSTSGQPIVLYTWDFDGDGIQDAAAETAVFKHHYEENGDFAVRLAIVDAGGLVTMSSVPVTIAVTNRAPEAVVGDLGGIVRAHVPMQFRATASDEDGLISAWHWEYGDGSAGEGADPVHTYEDPGTYVARLAVADDDGALSATVSVTVVVEDAPPSAAFTVCAIGADGGPAVWFIDRTSISSPTDIIYVGWDFGDGVYRAGGGPPSPDGYVHVYESPGTYLVTLYIIDKFGTMSVVSQAVWVRD